MSGSAGAEWDDYQDDLEQRQQDAYAPAAPAYAPPTPAAPAIGGALGGYRPRTAGGAERYAAFQARTTAANAPFQFADDSQPVTVGGPAAPPASKQGMLKDFGDQVWTGVLGIGEDVTGAAAFANKQLGANPDIAAHIDSARQVFVDHTAKTLAGMSPQAQQAMHASIFNDGSDPTNAPTWGQAGYVRTAAATLAGLVPQIALAVLPAAVVSRAAIKIASLAGASAGTAVTAGTAAGIATTAGAFGTTDAGAAWNAIVDQVEKATPEEMASDPVYQHMRETGLSDLDARQQLLKTPGLAANIAMHFGVGAAAGVGVGGLLRGAGVAGGRALTRTAIGAGEGAAVMGGQSAADTDLSQRANQAIGTQQTYDLDETLKAGMSGALGGALLGAGGALLHGGKPTRLPGPQAAAVAPDVAAALNEQLQLEGPAAQRQLEGPKPAAVGGAAIPMPGEAGVAPVPPSTPGVSYGDLRNATTNQAAPPAPSAQLAIAGPAEPPSAAITPAVVPMGGALHPPPPPAPGVSYGDMRANPSGARPAQLSPADAAEVMNPPGSRPEPAPAPARITSTQVQRRDGVGHNEAVRRAAAENSQTLPQDNVPVTAETPPVSEEKPPQRPTTRLGLLKALVAAGEDQKSLARMKIPDLQRRFDALHPPVTPDVAGEGGRTNTNTVNDPSVASAAQEPSGGVLTSSAEKDLPATPPERTASAASEPAGLATPPETKTSDTPVVNPDIPKAPLTKGEQLRADAQAKRAAAKAALAKPGERIVTGAHTGAPEAVTADAGPAYDPVAAATKVRDAAGRAARMESLPPGVVEGWVRDVTKIIQGVHSEDEAHAALADWGSKPGIITGAKVKRSVVADKMLKLLTGKGLAERDVLNREIARDAQIDRSVQENAGVAARADLEAASAREQDAARQETIDRGGENSPTVGETEEHGENTGGGTEVSQGVVDHSAGGEKVRSEATTDKTRILSDLEHKIRNEGLTIAEADAAYGKQEGVGRRRKYPDVASWVRERIASEEDPTTKAHLVEALAKHEDPIGTAVVQQNAPRPYNEHLTKPGEKAANKLAVDAMNGVISQKEAIAGLARLVREGTIPEGVARVNLSRLTDASEGEWRAAKGEPKPLFRRATEDGVSPTSSRYAQAVADPRLNSFVRDQIQAREASGTPLGLHETLDMIANHGTGPDGAPMRELAGKIRKWVKDIPVMSQDHAVQRGLMSFGERSDFEGGVLRSEPMTHGVFQRMDDGNHHIVLNSDSHQSVETTMHEALHSVTADHIDNLLRENPDHPELQALDAIRQELLAHGASGANADYALSNVHELHTMLMTNPELQAFAASKVASAEFRARMRELGFPPREQGRSIWQAFKDWIRRAVGLPKVASASEDTLLDYVMRPLQDITRRAVEHNARNLPTDPALRAQAEPLYRVASGAMGKAGDELRSRINVSSVGDWARSKVLAATNLDQIVTRYQQIFDSAANFTFSNPLNRVRDASEKVAHRQHQFTKDYGDAAATLVSKAHALDPAEYQTLGKLLNDATIAEAALGSTDAKANDHLTTPEQQAELAALQARYAKLSPEAKEVHRGVVDFYRKSGTEERRAELNGVMSRAFPDATDAQRDAFAKTGMSKDGFEQFLADPDNSAIAAAHATDWAQQRALTVGIAKILSVGRVRGDYTALGRFGDYVLKYGEKGTKDFGFEMFERKGDAIARRAELLQSGAAGVEHVDLKNANALRQITRDHPLINEVENALRTHPELAEHADDVRDIMNKIVLQASTRADVTRARRRGIQGASTDFARVMSKDFVNTAGRVGYLEHGAERFKALSDMGLVAEDLAKYGKEGEAIQARQVIHELQLKVGTQESAGGALASASRAASSFGYVQSLMSFSHIITNTIEAHMNSVPMLGARHSPGRVTLALSKAMADVAPTMIKAGARNTMAALGKGLKAANWDLSTAVRDRLLAKAAPGERAGITQLFKQLSEAGIIDHSETRELRRIAHSGGPFSSTAGRKVAGWWDKFTDFMGVANHAADVLNKSAIAKAAYDLELRHSKGNVDQAVAYALQLVRDTSPNYNLANKNRFSTSAGILGGAAGPITQFKQYGFHMYGVLGNLVKASISGASKEERNQARIAFAGVLATHAMMAGSITLIADPLRYIGGLYDYFVDGVGTPHNYQSNVRNWMAGLFGPTAAEIFSRGLPHALGIDLHQRIGLNDLLAIPALESFDSKGVIKMMGTAVLGASGEDAATLMDGFNKMRQGDIGGGMVVAPRPIRDVYKAIKLANQGVTDSRGRAFVQPGKVSAGDITAQAFGIQPSRVSEAREGRNAVLEAQNEAKAIHGKLSQAWLSAAPADRPAVMSQIRVFNQDNPGMRITVDNLVKQMAAARKLASQPATSFGLKMNPVQARSYAPAGAFANVN